MAKSRNKGKRSRDLYHEMKRREDFTPTKSTLLPDSTKRITAREQILEQPYTFKKQRNYIHEQRIVNQYRPKRTIAKPVVTTSVIKKIRNQEQHIRKMLVCSKRKIRREVLHALKLQTKRGQGSRARFTPESYIKCGG